MACGKLGNGGFWFLGISLSKEILKIVAEYRFPVLGQQKIVHGAGTFPGN
jgi:hypothetical protein